MRQMILRFNKGIKIEIKKSIIYFFTFLRAIDAIISKRIGGDGDVLAESCTVASPRDCENLFKGWLNNRMAILLMLVERPKPKKEKAILRIVFFLEDLRHHYMPAVIDDEIAEAFDYLQDYFGAYPVVTDEQCQDAKRMVDRIYKAIGYGKKILIKKGEQKQNEYSIVKSRLALFQEATAA